MGFSFYAEVANIIANVDCNVDGHLRVKEIFESFEVYKVLANFIVAAQRTITAMDPSDQNNLNNGLIKKNLSVYTIACMIL